MVPHANFFFLWHFGQFSGHGLPKPSSSTPYLLLQLSSSESAAGWLYIFPSISWSPHLPYANYPINITVPKRRIQLVYFCCIITSSGKSMA
jgi:hypothetical protein